MSAFSLASASFRAAAVRTSSATSASTLITKRTFTSLPRLRPSLITTNSTVFRPAAPTTTSLYTPPSSNATELADLVPKGAITSHPSLAGPQQLRFGPRPNLEVSSRLVRKRRHGFLSRIKNKSGRKIIARRRAKGRKMLSN